MATDSNENDPHNDKNHNTEAAKSTDTSTYADMNKADMNETGASETKDTVLEAEIIDEPKAAPSEAHSAPTKPSKNITPKKKNTAAIAGWTIAGLCASFIGGLVAYPYVAPQLQALGLVGTASPATSDFSALERSIQEQLAAQKAIVTQEQQQALERANDRYQVILGQLNAQLEQIKTDMANTQTPPLSAPLQTIDIDAERAKIAQLEASIAALSAQLSDIADHTTAPTGLDGKINLVTSDVNITKTDIALLKQEINGLSSSVSALKNQSIQATPRGRLAVSLANLHQDAVAGQPVHGHLLALQDDIDALTANDRYVMRNFIEQLLALTKTGPLQSHSQLLAGFDAAARSIITEKDKQDGKFLAGLFTIRQKAGPVDGLDQTLNQIEARLKDRDHQATHALLLQLDPALLRGTNEWVHQVAQYYQADTAFSTALAYLTEIAAPVAISPTKPTVSPTSITPQPHKEPQENIQNIQNPGGQETPEQEDTP